MNISLKISDTKFNNKVLHVYMYSVTMMDDDPAMIQNYKVHSHIETERGRERDEGGTER